MRNYPCKYCRRVFCYHKSGLIRHIDFKHQREDTEKRSHKCSNCSKAFHLKKSLDRHFWSQHRGESRSLRMQLNMRRRLLKAEKPIETRTVEKSRIEDHEDQAHVDHSQSYREENNNCSFLISSKSNLTKHHEVRGDREKTANKSLHLGRRFKCLSYN